MVLRDQRFKRQRIKQLKREKVYLVGKMRQMHLRVKKQGVLPLKK